MKVTRTEGQIIVESSYNPSLPKRAKMLGGRWVPEKRSWSFDLRDEPKVCELYRSLYGEWDNDNKPTADSVTVKITAEREIIEITGGVYFAGREIARATGKFSGAKLAPGIVMIGGKIASGGSGKYWETIIRSGAIFEIKDVPISKVEDEFDGDWRIDIISKPDFAGLLAEKEQLQKRLVEIERILQM